MERLWSPWRSTYVESADTADVQGNADSCFLCKCAQEPEPTKQSLLVARYKHCFVVLNKYPYNAGHLLIAPLEHTARMEELPKEVAEEMMHCTQQAINVLNTVVQPHGYNFGANLGRTAGAGVPDHIHWHLVPRWSGDTNFMPTIGEVKVMSHALEDLWQKFTHGFAALSA